MIIYFSVMPDCLIQRRITCYHEYLACPTVHNENKLQFLRKENYSRFIEHFFLFFACVFIKQKSKQMTNTKPVYVYYLFMNYINQSRMLKFLIHLKQFKSSRKVNCFSYLCTNYLISYLSLSPSSVLQPDFPLSL